MSRSTLFSFPNPVNEVAARTVALGVVVMCLIALIFNSPWLLIPLTYGFLARVATGPTLSPLGTFATRVIAPRLPLHAKFTPGPPKRFAQAIGVAFTLAASAAFLFSGWPLARWFLVPLLLAASLEAFVGYCLGCKIFSILMRLGVIPADVCAECADISLRPPTSVS